MGKTSAQLGSMKRSRRYQLEKDVPLYSTLPNTLPNPTKYAVSLYSYLYLQWLKVGIIELGGTPNKDGNDESCLKEVVEKLKHIKKFEGKLHSECSRQTRLPFTEVQNVKKYGKTYGKSGSSFSSQHSLKRLNWKPSILGSFRMPASYEPKIKRQYRQRPHAYKLHQGGKGEYKQTDNKENQPQDRHSKFNPLKSETPFASEISVQVIDSDCDDMQWIIIDCEVDPTASGPWGIDKVDSIASSTSNVGDGETNPTESHSLVPKFIQMQISGKSQSDVNQGTSKFMKLDDMAVHSIANSITRDPMWCQSMPISPQFLFLKGKNINMSRSFLADITNQNNDDGKKVVDKSKPILGDITNQKNDNHSHYDNMMISEGGSPLRDLLKTNVFNSPPGTKCLYYGLESGMNSLLDHHGCLGVPEVSYQGLISPWNTRKFIPWSPSHLFVRAKEFPYIEAND